MQDTSHDPETNERTPDEELLFEARIKRLKSISPEVRGELRKRWLDLFGAIGNTLNDDPASPGAQELAGKWMELVKEMMGGDPYLMQNPAMYHDLREWPRSMSMFTDKRVWDFVGLALAAREGAGSGR